MTTIADLGEFGLIARITAGLLQLPGVVLGVGDDAALLEINGDELLVATCDSQVENTHFRIKYAGPQDKSADLQDIGRKALAVNLSDIAAMGAKPSFALISLLVPPTLDVTVLDSIYQGLQKEATRFGVTIVGGNIAQNAERLIIDITLLGTVMRDKVLRRDTAKPGDTVMVTGSLGSSAAGLKVLENAQLASKIPPEVLAVVLAAHRTPTPRVAAGQWLSQQGVTTGMDISDGLVADISHICKASDVGVNIRVESLPIQPEVATIADLLGKEPQDFALYGGEDYELLFTVSSDRAETIRRGLFDATGVEATPIGDVCIGSAPTVLHQGRSYSLPSSTGWDHLRPRSSHL